MSEAIEVLLTKAEAKKLNAQIKEHVQAAQSSLIDAAVTMKRFTDGQGWKALGYEARDHWIKAEFDRNEFFKLQNVSKLLTAGVPEEKVRSMKILNLQAMARQLPAAKWTDPEWQRKAISDPVQKFQTDVLQASVVEGTHFEEVVRRGFVASASAIAQWDNLLRIIEVTDGVTGMDSKLDLIVSEILNNETGASGVSRFEEYNKIMAGGNDHA